MENWTEHFDLLMVEDCHEDLNSQNASSNIIHRLHEYKMNQDDSNVPGTPFLEQPDAALFTAGQGKTYEVVTPAYASSEASTNNFSTMVFDLPLFTRTEETDSRALENNRTHWMETASSFYADTNVFDSALDMNVSTVAAAPSVEDTQIHRYLDVLNHSSSCFDKRCPLQECFKMRAFIGHVNNCPKAGSGCRLCRRFFLLSRLHSTTCTHPIGHCSVLFCSHFKLEAANV